MYMLICIRWDGEEGVMLTVNGCSVLKTGVGPVLFLAREQEQCCPCCSKIPPTFNEPKLDLRNVPEVHLAISQLRIVDPDS